MSKLKITKKQAELLATLMGITAIALTLKIELVTWSDGYEKKDRIHVSFETTTIPDSLPSNVIDHFVDTVWNAGNSKVAGYSASFYLDQIEDL